jgi:hypothetical protein
MVPFSLHGFSRRFPVFLGSLGLAHHSSGTSPFIGCKVESQPAHWLQG